MKIALIFANAISLSVYIGVMAEYSQGYGITLNLYLFFDALLLLTLAGSLVAFVRDQDRQGD